MALTPALATSLGPLTVPSTCSKILVDHTGVYMWTLGHSRGVLCILWRFLDGISVLDHLEF